MSIDYNELFKHLVLTEEHRKDLRARRGFSDEIIDRLGFKSSGKYLQDLDCLKDYPLEKKSLLIENVLIPYFSDKGIYHARPHKFGITGASVQTYVPLQLFPDNFDTIVIAESEFKAAASCVLGIPAIGVPGINTMSRSHFPKVLEAIRAINPKTVVILFDSEKKGDPLLPNFKKDFRNRYETELYKFITAILVKNSMKEFNEKIVVKIADIPSAWMVQGKADIDGCLACGMKPEEYADIVSAAVDPYEFKNSWKSKYPQPHVSYMERRIDKFFYNGPVFEIDNCYYIQREKTDGSVYKERISNFVIKMIHTVKDASNISQRFCKLISNYGSSNPVTISPEFMASKQSFTKFCYEQGDFEFMGSDPDLKKIWHYIFIRQDGLRVEQLTYHGYNADCETWFFRNGAYNESKFYEAENGIVWINDEGYMINNSSDDEDESSLAPDIIRENPGFSIDDIFKNMSNVMSDNYARIILGWSLGCYFMPEIIAKYKIYPFLFLYGTAGSGKSVTAGWISSFFGISLGDKGFQFHGSSVAGISRASSRLSMMPIWFEEYRNGDPETPKKNSYLRSIYDGSTILKGTKDPNKIVKYTARSTIILSGEEYPQDSALNSRCIQIPVYGKDRNKDNKESFQWLQSNKGQFSYFGSWILENKDALWEKVSAHIEGYTASMAESKNRKGFDRVRELTSIICGVSDAILGPSDQFESFVGEIVQKTESVRNSEQALNVFFDDLQNLAQIPGRFPVGIAKLAAHNDRRNSSKINCIVFNFALAYTAWEKEMKGMRSSLPISRKAIEENLIRENYFIRVAKVETDFGRRNCILLNANECPDSIKNLLSRDDKIALENGVVLGSARVVKIEEPVEIKYVS